MYKNIKNYTKYNRKIKKFFNRYYMLQSKVDKEKEKKIEKDVALNKQSVKEQIE